MITDVTLSIQEILKSKHFKNGKVVAGKAGLYRTVKWVHVMEVTQIDQLLNGNELILTTGVGWKGNKEIFLAFCKELIDSNAAGLCVELGTYIPSIPDEIIELANLHHFPIIAFYNQVRFVDITQDLHTQLIKKQHQMISDLVDNSHQLWIQKWLEGVHSEEQIDRFLSELEPNLKPNGCVVVLLKIAQSDEKNSEVTHLKLLFHSIFQSHGFFLLSTIRKNYIIFIMLNKRKNKDWKIRIETGLHQIQEEWAGKQNFAQVKCSIGKFINRLSNVKKSFDTARDTLIIQEKMPIECFSSFYEDLYIFRLVALANERGVLDEFISDYLGPVLHYDEQNNGKLVETLKMYLKCNGSKQETAAKLYIVRQTLYQRLHKLNELLGEDFMEFYKRQAIEFAITAYDYLSSSK